MTIHNIDEAESYINLITKDNQIEFEKKKKELRKGLKEISTNLKRWIHEDNLRIYEGKK